MPCSVFGSIDISVSIRTTVRLRPGTTGPLDDYVYEMWCNMIYTLQHGKVFLLKRNLNFIFYVDGANFLLLVIVNISV